MENNHIEYKEKLTSDLDLEKVVIAFLNASEGGVIYIGINDEGDAVGVQDLDGDMLKIKDRIKNNIEPSPMGLFDIINEVKGSNTVIKIIVASGSEKPYFKRKYGMTEKGCYMRVGSSSEPMPTKIIEKLFSTKTRHSIGKIKSNQQDLTFEQLRIYYEEKGLALNSNFKKNLELLTPEGDLNYVAYLLSDINNLSIRVAKYQGESRVEIIENNEYGYESLIKSLKNVLNKINLENKTLTQITWKERIETRPWNERALREAIVNAFVHNDYMTELGPKFEIFSDRIEITSNGNLPADLTMEELFEGVSRPRNRELMRVFKDLEFVEHLGSGIPRILSAYDRNCFKFYTNFTRMSFPSSVPLTFASQATLQATPQATLQATPQAELVKVIGNEMTRTELQNALGLKDREHFRKEYLMPALEEGLIEMTVPDKPSSPKQKYRLTAKGKSRRAQK